MNSGNSIRRIRAFTSVSAVVLLLVASGDGRVRSVPPPGLGIDPFEVLDLQVKPNVLIILDTSGSMQEDAANSGGEMLSGDDPTAKMFQAKKAINSVLSANAGKFNFGFASYNVLNSEKVLTDAPITYVTTTSEPGALIWSGGNSYFSIGPGTPYLATGSTTNALDAQVWRSFARTTAPFQGPGCASGVACRVHLRSRLFRDSIKFKWSTTNTTAAGQAASVGTTNILTSISTITCPLPPAGLFPDDPAGMRRPCFQMENSAAGGNLKTTTFWYTGVRWDPGANGTANCGGAAVLENVARCEVNNVTQVQQRLQLELPLWDINDPSANTNTCGGPRGTPCALQAMGDGSTASAVLGTNPAVTAGIDPNRLGVAAAQRTPLGATLRDVYDSFDTTFPLPGGGFDTLQKHFVVLLTDGAETCSTNPVDYASRLWGRSGHAPGRYAETFVVGFSLNSLDQATLNAIACAGSGGTTTNCSGTTCDCAGGSRMTALSANNASTLADTITGILGSITAEGVFSSTPSVLDSVPEYVDTISAAPGYPAYTPLNPATRYNADAFRSYRASFDTNGFRGLMHAFDSSGAIAQWEAGSKLLARVDSSLATTNRTFAEITSGGLVRRRIFTSVRNGIAPTTAMLWNVNGPDSSVVPNSTSTNGVVDDALFQKSDGTQMTQTELQSTPLYACLGVNLPSLCTSTNAGNKLAMTRREAREMILAYTAGVEAVRDASGYPVRNTSGEILYRKRSWVLGTSTLATPALITPPINKVPTIHQAEYLLYRDGPRDTTTGEAINAIDSGFGLRSPDGDGRERPTGALSRPALKPVMSVVYLPANDMLHALRAGPQCPTVAADASCTGSETGAEELWGFVPFDQLPKLRERLRPQTRANHTYMMAASLRFADVFVPGSFTLAGQAYSGRWRRVLLAGRGVGGSYVTALDVTAPGPFTRASLSTNLPSVLWSRGNPDTQNGTAGGTRNGTAAEQTLYADLGQTWSVPAVARSTAFADAPEFVAYFGSGYGTAANQGTRFYTVNVLNGSILASANVGDAAGAAIENAIVADPVTYAAERLRPGTDLSHPAGSVPTAVYAGDIHGRMWRFRTGSSSTLSSAELLADAGVSQPIGVAAALLTLGDPYVFFTTGADARVAAPASQFSMWAVKDDATPGTVVSGFPVPFPSPGTGQGPYRGTVAPLSAFLNSEGVVFFVGTRFNPIAAGRCVSSFDSIVYALFARDGTSVYDTLEYTNTKIVGMPVPPVDTGDGRVPADVANPAPGETLPPPPPVPESGPNSSAVAIARVVRPSSSVCRF